MRILAIDQGTTSTRAILFSQTGDARHIGSRSHRNEYPRHGWVEQDANELAVNILSLIEAAGPVDAIGLANQGESCLAWDSVTKEPLSPIIVWQDTRTVQILERMAAEGFEKTVRRRAALPLDPYFSAAKLGWIVANLPKAAAALKAGRLRLGTTDAFFLDRLAGCFATDRATASRTSLMNMETGEWDEELCRLFGVPLECLPPIRSNIAGFGSIAGARVGASIVDQQAALYGHGCRIAGDAKVTFGTGAFALTVTGTSLKRDALESGLLPTVAWDLGDETTYAIDGGVQDAGSAIEWALRAGLARSLLDFEILEPAPAVERGLVFIPAFSGLGCPTWDRSASPLIIGLQPSMDRRDMCQALLEGVAFLTSQVLAAIGNHCALQEHIPIDGGIAANSYFVQFLANCSGRSFRVGSFAEQTAAGVASLAALALGEEIDPPRLQQFLVGPSLDGAVWSGIFNDAICRARGWRPAPL
ncbi:FGGY family carbohydrate kinase [Rhizobium sp. A37_96]